MATNMATGSVSDDTITVRAWYNGSRPADECDIECWGPGYDERISVEYGYGGSGSQTNWTTPYVAFRGLSPGTTYSFQASFYQYDGRWTLLERSDVFRFTTDGSQGLATPDPYVTDYSATSAYVEWDSIYGATSYEAEVWGPGGYDVTIETSRLYALFDGLTPNTSYSYRVRAYSRYDGYSDWSMTRSFRTRPGAPSAPYLRLNEVTHDTIYIYFEPEALADKYMVMIETRDDNSFSDTIIINQSSYTISVLFSSLVPSTRYIIRAYAYNDYGDSSWSNTLYVTTSAPPKSRTPVPGLISRAEGMLQFSYGTGADEYELKLEVAWSGRTTYSDTFSSSQIFVDLEHGTLYYFYARAKESGKNWSDWSTRLSVYTLPLTPTITAAGSKATSATININVASGTVTGYRIRTLNSSGTLIKTNTVSTTSLSTSYEITGLTSGTTYMFEVESFHNHDGTNAYSQHYSNRVTIKVGHAKPGAWAWEYTIRSGGTFYRQDAGTVYLMRAIHWNDFTEHINKMRRYKNLSDYNFTTASSSTAPTAVKTCINQAINAVNPMLPSNQQMGTISSGQVVAASIFLNLRDRLNNIT